MACPFYYPASCGVRGRGGPVNDIHDRMISRSTTYWLVGLAVAVHLFSIAVTMGQSHEAALELHFAVRGGAGVFASIGILVGVARYRPKHRLPWYLLALMAASYSLRFLVLSGILPGDDWMVLVAILAQSLTIVGALLAFVITRRAITNRRMWLETLTVMLLVAAFHFCVSVVPGWRIGDSLVGKIAFSVIAPLSYVLQSGLLIALLYSHHFRGIAARLVFLAVGMDIIIDATGHLGLVASNAAQIAALDVATMVALLWMAAALDPTMLELDEPAENTDNGWNPASRAMIGVAAMLPLAGVLFTEDTAPVIAAIMLGLVGIATMLLIRRIRGTLDSLAIARADSEVQARTDPLTGLLNLRGLKQAVAERPHEAFGVVYIDIDRFKLLNDLNGHSFGDDLLCQVAARLRRAGPGISALARVGGDEYVALFFDKAGVDERVAEIVRLVFTKPFMINGAMVTLSASIGLARAASSKRAWAESPKDPSRVLAEMVRLADMAQYQAKYDGGARTVVYAEGLELELKRSALISAALKGDLNEVLELYYQAVVNIATDEVVGVEALCRMRHPELGLVSPSEFIAIAESFDHINELGSWVFRRATEDLKASRMPLPEHFHLSINLSPRQLHSATCLSELLRWADSHPQLIDHVRLEVTETAFVSGQASERLADLRNAGYQIAIDDFGSRYAALSNLHRYRIDVLKLDYDFVADLGKSRECEAVVATVVQLARVLNLEVVGEGIENCQQARILKRLGCENGQGFLWHRPSPGLAEHVHAATSRTPLPLRLTSSTERSTE